MTDPNSASPQPNSASVHIVDKLLFVLVCAVFWFNAGAIVGWLARWMTHAPLKANPSSAFSYMFIAGLLLLVERSWISQVFPLLLTLAAASVFMLNLDSWGYHILLSVAYMCWADEITAGNVMPWSKSWRRIFM